MTTADYPQCICNVQPHAMHPPNCCSHALSILAYLFWKVTSQKNPVHLVPSRCPSNIKLNSHLHRIDNYVHVSIFDFSYYFNSTSSRNQRRLHVRNITSYVDCVRHAPYITCSTTIHNTYIEEL